MTWASGTQPAYPPTYARRGEGSAGKVAARHTNRERKLPCAREGFACPFPLIGPPPRWVDFGPDPLLVGDGERAGRRVPEVGRSVLPA